MIYDVRQMTAYTYASPVTYARHVLRLTPIDRPRQRVHVAALDVLPAPIRRREVLTRRIPRARRHGLNPIPRVRAELGGLHEDVGAGGSCRSLAGWSETRERDPRPHYRRWIEHVTHHSETAGHRSPSPFVG